MMRIKRRLPGPAMMVAGVALLVALSGTAVAATAIVPLAKRALTADKAKVATLAQNAQKLNGQTASAIVSQASQAPGPASSAAGLVSTNTAPFSVAANGEQVVTATCASGSKAVGGGFANPTSALVVSAGSLPTADGSGWTEDLVNISDSTTGAGLVIVSCLK